MAGAVRTGGGSRRSAGTADNGRTYVYVDGTAVRKVQAMPQSRPQGRPQSRPQERRTTSVSRTTRRNRERALSMNFGYVIFLAAAAVITVFMCVNFLQLQAKETRLQKEVTSLETQLDAAILENDSDYNRIMTGVDMEHVKDVAMNELGMVYAKRSQVVTYELGDSDYVRRYAEVPKE